jgi:hypothetical protein
MERTGVETAFNGFATSDSRSMKYGVECEFVMPLLTKLDMAERIYGVPVDILKKIDNPLWSLVNYNILAYGSLCFEDYVLAVERIYGAKVL